MKNSQPGYARSSFSLYRPCQKVLFLLHSLQSHSDPIPAIIDPVFIVGGRKRDRLTGTGGTRDVQGWLNG